MFLDAFRIRLALLGMGLVALLVFVVCGGRLGPPKEGVVQIEFGMYPDEFAGLPVEVDGRPVGKLRYFGSVSRTGFLLEPGPHEIRVAHPKYASQPRTLEVESGGTTMLILGIGEVAGSDGSVQTALVFQ